MTDEPNALTRDEQIRATALAAANQRLGERSIEPPKVAITILLNAAREIEAYLRGTTPGAGQ